MLGYFDDPEATLRTLITDSEGRVWLRTGDMGIMDDTGYIYFKQRLKHVIKTSGYNINPSQIENVLDSLPEVARSSVVGLPDPIRGQSIKAFIILAKGVQKNDATTNVIRSRIRDQLSKYAMPSEYEFVDSLPETLFGKTDIGKLVRGQSGSA
jgi:long-chain acyl-CoA synthetase